MSDAQEVLEAVNVTSGSSAGVDKKPRKKWSYYSRMKLSRTRKRMIAEGKIKYVKGVTGSVSGRRGRPPYDNGYYKATKADPVVENISQTVRNRIKALRMELRTLLKFKASLQENDIANLLR